MADKDKQSQRDTVLVNILERIAGQLNKEEQLIEDVIKRHKTLASALEESERRAMAREKEASMALEASELRGQGREKELAQALESSELRMFSRIGELRSDVEKLQESFSRYRSDMLSLVGEQDRINKNIIDLNAQVNKTAYALESSKTELTVLKERAKAQEKTASDHFALSLKQAEAIPKEIAESDRNAAKLHVATEKNLGNMHRETQKQLERLQQDMVRRLFALGGIESALQTLLIRTEPPEKKPFFLIVALRKASGAVRSAAVRALRWVRSVFNRKKAE